MTLGIVSGRSYGEGVDAILEDKKGAKNIFSMYSQDSYGRLVDMLMSDRVDYILGYAVEFGYKVRKDEIEEGKIKFFPIKEAGVYSMSHVVCSKTPAGKAIIDDVNKVLLKWRPMDKYRSFVERWLDKDY